MAALTGVVVAMLRVYNTVAGR